MKTTMISITTVDECATIQVRCAGEYVVKNVNFSNGKTYFPFAELIKMLLKIKLNQYKNWLRNDTAR